MENKITISVEAYGITHTAALSEECTAAELIEIYSQMVESISFDSSLVVDGLKRAIENRE